MSIAVRCVVVRYSHYKAAMNIPLVLQVLCSVGMSVPCREQVSCGPEHLYSSMQRCTSWVLSVQVSSSESHEETDSTSFADM